MPGVPPNFRNNPSRNPCTKLAYNGEARSIEWRRLDRHSYEVNGAPVELLGCSAGGITIAIGNVRRNFAVSHAGEELSIHSTAGERIYRKLPRHPRPIAGASRAAANSPMPGHVLRVLVRKGQCLTADEPLVVLEAMKMEQTIKTTINGVVQSILVAPGQRLHRDRD